ncbi:hypothetical protein ACLMJK_006782 [Lecanora helva]
MGKQSSDRLAMGKVKEDCTWQFVNICDPVHRKKRHIQKAVRANAMRYYRKEQRQHTTGWSRYRAPHVLTREENKCGSSVALKGPTGENTVDHCPLGPAQKPIHLASLPPDATMDHTDMYVANCRGLSVVAEYADEEHQYYVVPYSDPSVSVGLGVKDPFDSLPLEYRSGETSYILHHFASSMAIDCLPTEEPITKKWLRFALHDRALLSATMAFAATHLDILNRSRASQSSLWHKQATIRMINAKLESPEEVTSNANIGAVAMMASMESISGNYEELKVHMGALRRMVSIRGGLENLGWEGILHMLLSWQDLSFSGMSIQDPHFGLVPCQLLTPGTLPFSSPMHPATMSSLELSKEIFAMFNSMRYMQLSLKSWSRPFTQIEFEVLKGMRKSIVDRLFMLGTQNNKPRCEWNRQDYFLESRRYAALIYVHIVLLSHLPIIFSESTLCALKDQLIVNFHQSESTSVQIGSPQPRPNQVTWVLLMGAMFAQTEDDVDWFATRIAKMCRVTGVRTWQQTENRLANFCCGAKPRTKSCERVWAEVERINEGFWEGTI